jgi:hypothetical protein
MIVVIDKDRGCWIEFIGTMEQAEKRYTQKSMRKEIDAYELGPMAIASQGRPSYYFSLSGREQWDIDKDLGILDWDGDPEK